MGWTIIDEDELTISFDRGDGKRYVDKSSIHFGDPIIEPFLFVSWKNNDFPLMQQGSDPEQQKEEAHHIYYKTAVPLEASAANLKVAIQLMIISGWGGTGSGDEVVIREIPAGALDGTNPDFTTAFNYAPGNIAWFIDDGGTGSLIPLKPTIDFTETGPNMIKLNWNPRSGTVHYVIYKKA